MMMRRFSFFLLSTLFVNGDFNLTKLDKYHENICHVLINSSNSIDNYFIDENSSVSSRTEAEVKTSFAFETACNSEFAMRLRLRLNLPKLQNKFRLVLEDEESDNPLYDATTLDNQYQVENKNYFLSLEYFDYVLRDVHFSSALGVRFRKSTLQPYVNLKARYILTESQEESALLSNRLRVYVDEDVENITTYDLLERFEDDFYVFFHNIHRYESWERDKIFINSLSLTKVLQEGREVTWGVAFNNRYNPDKIEILYPQLYMSYRDWLYKKWIYYELTPSLLWREENDYQVSERLMFSLGTVFKSSN